MDNLILISNVRQGDRIRFDGDKGYTQVTRIEPCKSERANVHINNAMCVPKAVSVILGSGNH